MIILNGEIAAKEHKERKKREIGGESLWHIPKELVISSQCECDR